MSQREDRGKWKERTAGGRRRGEAVRKEKRRELEPVSYISEHQDRQPHRAPGNEARLPCGPALGGSGEPQGSDEHSVRRMLRLLLWATRFHKIMFTCNDSSFADIHTFSDFSNNSVDTRNPNS